MGTTCGDGKTGGGGRSASEGSRLCVVTRTGGTVGPIATIRTVAAIRTSGTVAARAATAAFLAVAVVALAQHRRRAGLVRLDAQRHETDHVLVEAELALEFDDRRRRRVDVQKREIRLTVLFDAKGEGFETPCLDLRHRAALRGDQRLELFGESFDLRRSHILTRHIDMLVESHDQPFCFPSRPTLSPSSPWKGSTRIHRRREHGKTGRALPSDYASAAVRPSVQPPAGHLEVAGFRRAQPKRKQKLGVPALIPLPASCREGSAVGRAASSSFKSTSRHRDPHPRLLP